MDAMFKSDNKSNMKHCQQILQWDRIYLQSQNNADRTNKLPVVNTLSALDKMLIAEPNCLSRKVY